jgi:hypothetical protein
MKKMLWFFVTILLGIRGVFATSCLEGEIRVDQGFDDAEMQVVHDAERALIVDLACGQSETLRNSNDPCVYTMPGELIIGLLGINRNRVSSEIFIRIMGLKTDAGYSEEFHCILALYGNELYRYLIHMNVGEVERSCKSHFYKLQEQGTKGVRDVSVEQICHTESEIERERNSWLEAIRSGVTCEDY